MRVSELVKLIRYQLSSGEHPGTEIVIDLLDTLIDQGGATLGEVKKIKELILEWER
jgi:hypothetical protein